MLEFENDGKRYNPPNMYELEEIGLLLLIIKGNRQSMDGIYDNILDTYIGRLINSLRPYVLWPSRSVKYGT